VNCGATEALQVHHVVRLEDGGAEFDLNNLVTLCVGCHGEQHRGDPGSRGREALTPRARFSRNTLEPRPRFSRNRLLNVQQDDEGPLMG
jgi:5-methylcytosine-specific restriction endonuclease McrA